MGLHMDSRMSGKIGIFSRRADAGMRLISLAFRGAGLSVLMAVLPGGFSTMVHAQTDEIQVYDGEIAGPGKFSLAFHNNYTPSGRTQPEFPGGIIPDHALNGTLEWAYGVKEWMELGAYFPLYSRTGDGSFLYNGAKVRTTFVVPHARERRFFYGANFEFSYNAAHWEQTEYSGEVRLIIGGRWGPMDVIINPIWGTQFKQIGDLDFGPAERIAWNFSQAWAAAIEHYSDYGPLRQFMPAGQQNHSLFAVLDYNGEPDSVEFGVGQGLTPASDATVIKLIIEHAF